MWLNFPISCLSFILFPCPYSFPIFHIFCTHLLLCPLPPSLFIILASHYLLPNIFVFIRVIPWFSLLAVLPISLTHICCRHPFSLLFVLLLPILFHPLCSLLLLNFLLSLALVEISSSLFFTFLLFLPFWFFYFSHPLLSSVASHMYSLLSCLFSLILSIPSTRLFISS